MARKSLEQELLEAKLRAERAWQKKKDDLAWKHRIFWPTIDSFLSSTLTIDKEKELEPGD
jgi:hypothetical protein